MEKKPGNREWEGSFWIFGLIFGMPVVIGSTAWPHWPMLIFAAAFACRFSWIAGYGKGWDEGYSDRKKQEKLERS